MYRVTVALSVVVIALFGAASTASAHGMSVAEKQEAKQTYYHSDGYMKAIWKNARRTVYHPNYKKREKWWAALKYLQAQKHRAWVKLHPEPHYVIDRNLLQAFTCIHHYEGAWNANTGNGYYGGLQMDVAFQSLYGPEFLRMYGTADRWPISVQLQVAARAYHAGRGFYPWPNTARACGLI